MPEANAELGRAVSEVLSWMDVSPETAGAALGINARTLAAMSQGIVPMRSLVIRFAAGVAHRCEGQSGIPDWWADVDAWLRVAGYTPRRDGPADVVTGLEPPLRHPQFRPPRAQPAAGPTPSAAAVPQSGPDEHPEPPAREFYHPVYERETCGDTFVHIFWIMDREDRKTFQMHFAANVDYKARAAQVKQDLAALSRGQFERKYGRFRVNGR